jgi:hypothetical protein
MNIHTISDDIHLTLPVEVSTATSLVGTLFP